MAAAPAMFGANPRIGVIGLGAGTLACYARPGQKWTFYEIDPAMHAIAMDSKRFTFMSRCLPQAPTIIGDARLTLEQGPAQAADVLVVDAFSSDSIPMHLLTQEAFAAYSRHLAPGGLLMVHISNRYLDLEPVIAAAAQTGGWKTALRPYRPSAEALRNNERGSNWVALARDQATLDQVVRHGREEWRPLKHRPGFKAWTDDYASLLPLIR